MTGFWLVTAAIWPGIAAAGMGALLVVLPRLTGLEAYHLTAVREERQILGVASLRWIGTILLVQLAVGATSALLNDWVGAFGHPRPLDLVLAGLWPVFGFVLGVAGAQLLPRGVRLTGVALSPAIMFYLVAGAAALEPGALASLSPINVLALPNAAEPWSASAIRVTAIGGLVAVCGSRVLARWLRWPGIGLTVGALVAAFWMMPASAVPMPGADAPQCREVESTRVCWSAWGRVGSDRFVSALTPVLQRTPRAMRPSLIAGTAEPLEPKQGHMWIGYPSATNTVAVRPDPASVRRAYARGLVTSNCSTSPVEALFAARTARAVGITRGEPVGLGELSDSELTSALTGDERTLFLKLSNASDSQALDLVADLARDPAWCSAGAAAWIKRLS